MKAKRIDVNFEINKKEDYSLVHLKNRRFPMLLPYSLSAREIQEMEDKEIAEWLEEMSIIYPIMMD